MTQNSSTPSSSTTASTSAAPKTSRRRSTTAARKKSARRSTSRETKKAKSERDELTRKQALFLDVAEDFALRGKPLFLKDIALASEIDVTTPSRWMRQVEFRERYAQVIRDSHPVLVEGALTSLLQAAIRGGRVDAFDAAMDRMERHGRFGPALAALVGTSTDPATAAGVHVHIHGLPQRDDFHSLPPTAARALPPGATKAAAAVSAASR